MKILVFGAGIIGSVYAARLFETKQDVTLLARGNRYEDLKTNGVVLKDCISKTQTKLNVPLVTGLEAGDFCDLIIVAVCLNQLDEIISVLKKNNACSNVLFMMNNPMERDVLLNELSSKNIILGFPGMGGTYRDNVIEYINIKQQKTTIGTVHGQGSPILISIKKILEAAKFKTAICSDMQSWLKTHVVFISCISAAIFKEDGNPVQLSKKRNSVKLMVQSIREGFLALKSLHIKILPANLNILFMKMPQWFAVLYWQKALKGETGKLAIAPHAAAAKDEMQLLAKIVWNMVHSSRLSTPALNSLLSSYKL